MKQRFHEIQLTAELPSPSQVGMRILQLLGEEDYSVEEIVGIVRCDPALVGRILKVANSSTYGFRERLTTIEHASVVLGRDVLQSIALGFCVVAEHCDGACEAFDYGAYWRAAMGRAVAGQQLGRFVGLNNASAAYLCGLLGDIGRLGLATAFPDDYSEMVRNQFAPEEACALELEEARFGINHHQLTEMLLMQWGLSLDQVEATVEGHRQSQLGGELVSDLVKVLRAGRLLITIWSQGLERESEFEMWTQSGRRPDLRLDEEDFFRLREVILEDWGVMLSVVGIQPIKASAAGENVNDSDSTRQSVGAS